MRLFANLFLILFIADGGFSLLDELVSFVSPFALLSGARDVVAGTVIVMAFLVYLCLGIDRRLPKRVFLPLILFVFLCPLSATFFPALTGSRIYPLLAAAAQVLLGLLLCRFRQERGRSVTMPRALFDARWFSLRNTLAFGAATLFILPFALVLFALYAANSFMAEYTPGFMRVGPGGLYMTERVYRRDSRTIRLASMIHIGDRQYYDQIAGLVGPGRTVVLAEGVTDEKHLLHNRFDYRKMAGLLGLTSQDKMLFRGRLIEAESLDEAPLPRSPGTEEKQAVSDIIRADVDLSSFHPPTILLLDTTGKQLRENPSVVKALLSLSAWGNKNITEEMQKVIMDDILYRRNREVIRYLGKALNRYDTVVIPWGAMHMKEIEGEVLKRGFKLQEERERVSVDFRRMLLGRLH